MTTPSNPVLKPIVVFDLDGTLLDTAPDLLGALNKALATLDMEPAPFERLHSYVGQGGEMMIRRVFKERGIDLPETLVPQLVERFVDAYDADIPGTSKPYEGVMELVADLRQAGFATAICTNKYQRLSAKLLETMDLAQHFDAICGSDVFPVKKPDPNHLWGTIEMAGGDPKRAVMVGDSITDINAAKNAGIPVVAVTFGYTDEPVETLGPDHVISHYKDLNIAIIESLMAKAQS